MPVEITTSEFVDILPALAEETCVLVLGAPGIAKSACVVQAATNAGLECRSLLGTQIAPEDVSGIPKIVGERSVFCPPRVLLPEDRSKPVCIFADEMPACSPDVQKALYSLLLERRVGEHSLPPKSWVVAAGNRTTDKALVRTLSSALVNRVTILHLRMDPNDWLRWASANQVRSDIQAFIRFLPEALTREPENEPYSTPRSWTRLSASLDLLERAGKLRDSIFRAQAFGNVSPYDAALFCAIADGSLSASQPAINYVRRPALLPQNDSDLWLVLWRVRQVAVAGELSGLSTKTINSFLRALRVEHRAVVLMNCAEIWTNLGAQNAILESLVEIVAK